MTLTDDDRAQIRARQERLSGVPLDGLRWHADALGLLIEQDVPVLLDERDQLAAEVARLREENVRLAVGAVPVNSPAQVALDLLAEAEAKVAAVIEVLDDGPWFTVDLHGDIRCVSVDDLRAAIEGASR